MSNTNKIKIFNKNNIIYDEDIGAEIFLNGCKTKLIKEKFGNIYYQLDEPIENKLFIKEYYSEPIGTNEGTILFELVKNI